jgi:PAS domain S-box-containing protein
VFQFSFNAVDTLVGAKTGRHTARMTEPIAQSRRAKERDLRGLQLAGTAGAPNVRDEGAAADEPSYRQFVDALGVALYTTDAAGRITYYNDSAARLWGRRPEIGEEWCGSWRLYWPDGRPMPHDECPMAIALREGRPVRGWTAMAERPDGSRIDFQPYPTPLFDGQGRLVGAVNVLVDVTAQRRAQDDLRSTTAALTAASAVKDHFLGLVSHELRTPVTTIYGNAQLLHDRGTRLPENERAAMIADVAEDAERLLSIIENLLLFSRLQSGAVADHEPQMLTRVVEQEVASFSRRHPEHPIHLDVAPGRPIIVEADRTQLTLLLQNLLGNAHKYGRSDHGIEVEVEVGTSDVRVRVLDRGMGIAETDATALFEPFFRSKEAEQVAGGVGLGLAVCQRIVEGMGGRIWARSRGGGGSEFGFAMPISPEPADSHDDRGTALIAPPSMPAVSTAPTGS